MKIKDEYKKMVAQLRGQFAIPPIERIFFPPLYPGGQPKDAEFMAMGLKGGATGISYVLLPEASSAAYADLQAADVIGRDPGEYALEFGHDDPLKEMLGLAAINAICQHVMQQIHFPLDTATDSLGLLSICAGDRVGMVGLFSPLIETIRGAGAELIVIEKKGHLIQKYPHLPITLDASELQGCNKVLCTSTTILNNSLDDILVHCRPDATVSIIGPTAGYFPDPLFARGVDVVGGRVVKDGHRFIDLLEQRKRWGDATRKICFRKENYAGIMQGGNGFRP